MDIERIDINDKSFTIRDGKAIHVDDSDSLTEEEKAQARQNIGANTLIINDDQEETSDSINDAVSAGRNVVFKAGNGQYIPLTQTDQEYAYFVYIEATGNSAQYTIDRQGEIDVEVFKFALASNVDTQVANIENALDSKENTANRVTTIDETADDEHYPTAKAVYGYVTDTVNTAEPYIIRYTRESANDVYLETYFTWDELAAVAKTGRKVMCRVDGGYEPANITYYDLYWIDYNDRIAVFVTHDEGGKELLILSNSTYPAFKYLREITDATLSIKDAPADAAAVGEKLGDIEVARVTQQEQISLNAESISSNRTDIDNNTDAIATLTDHATYKKLYDRVEITEDDITAAGEEGIMEIAIGSATVDLSQYNDILVKVYIPKDEILNTEFGLLRIAWGVTASGNKFVLLSPQSGSLGVACKINHDNSNSFMVKMTFTDDTFLYGQVMKNGYGTSWGYAGVQNCWTEVDPNGKKSNFHYFRIADRFGKLKFPAGTYVEVYGR